jgi:hypothetical protein
MADAIPVHSEPKKKTVAVQASPAIDENSPTGAVIQGNYAAKPRENTVSDVSRDPVVIECAAPNANASAFTRQDN